MASIFAIALRGHAVHSCSTMCTVLFLAPAMRRLGTDDAHLRLSRQARLLSRSSLHAEPHSLMLSGTSSVGLRIMLTKAMMENVFDTFTALPIAA